jgi:hypothetical protein
VQRRRRRRPRHHAGADHRHRGDTTIDGGGDIDDRDHGDEHDEHNGPDDGGTGVDDCGVHDGTVNDCILGHGAAGDRAARQ